MRERQLNLRISIKQHSIQSEREQEPESDKCNREEIKSAKLDKDRNLLHNMLVKLAGEFPRIAFPR